jgi:hypothetical protein
MAYTGDPLQNDDRSPFLSFLDYIDEPGQVVKNLLRGNLGAAGRHVLNFAGDTIDAALPGDWIPKATTAEDNVTSSELIGLDEKEHPILGFGANLVGDTLLNPLSYLSMGAAGAGASAGKAVVKAGLPFMKGALEVPGSAKALEAAGDLAKKGFQALPEDFQTSIQAAGRGIRSTFGAQRAPEHIKQVLSGSRAGTIEAEAGMKAAKAALSGFDDRQLEIIGDSIDNFRWQDGKLVGELIDTSMDPIMGKRSGSILDRIMAHPNVAPGEAERLAEAAEKTLVITRNQKGRKGIFSADDQTNLSDEYLGRHYENLPDEAALDIASGTGNAMKERQLHSWQKVRDFLGQKGNEKVKYSRNALQRSLGRSAQQGNLARQADLGAGIMDLVRQGKLELPDELIEDVAASMGKERFPVGASEAGGVDIMGVRSAKPTGSEIYGVPEISGKAKPPTTGAIEETVSDPYGIGSYSGTAKPPTGEASSRLVSLLLKGDLKGARKAVEDMAKGGEVDDSTLNAYLGLLEKAAPAADEVAEIAEDVAKTPDPYGLGSLSGRSKPPKTPTIEPNAPDPYGLGSLSGKSVVGKGASDVDLLQRAGNTDPYGLGSPPSGTSVVGKSTVKQKAPAPEQANPRGFTPDQLAKAKDQILSKEFARSDPKAHAAVKAVIEKLRGTDPEAAQLLGDAYNGMPKPGWIGRMLQRGNSIFKPAATAGYALPNLGFNIRNRLSGIWSTLSNPEARGATGGMAKRFPSDIAGAITEGLGLSSRDRLGKVLNAWESALAASGGSADNAFRIMEQGGFQKEASLLRSGVLDGFVRSEDILSELTKPGILAKLHRGAKWPAKITKGIEDRMRLGLALDTLDTVKDPAKAVGIARDTLFDYDVSSTANRAYRQGVPFGQFMGKAVPQQAKFLGEKPAVGVALSSALGQGNDDPIYPYMEGKLNVPLGDDDQGNSLFSSGFGLPFEALNQIPGSFRDVKKNVVGAVTPPLKSLYSAISGEDPYFETPYGSYDKMPLVGRAGDVGQAYNQLAGTGLIQPLSSPLGMLDKILDERRSPGIKALDLLTGAKVTSVDPDLAMQQQLTEALRGNPDVHQYRGYFADSEDDATQALIRAYQDAKAKLKKKRKARGD